MSVSNEAAIAPEPVTELRQASTRIRSVPDRLAGELEEISQLSERVSTRLDQLADEAEELRAQMQRAIRAVSGIAAEAGGAEAGRRPGDGQLSGNGAEAVRLLAIQMLAAGESRSEARDRLIGEFGIRDPDEVLDRLELRRS